MTEVLIEYLLLGAAVLLILTGIALVASGIRRRPRLVMGVCCLLLSGALFWRIQHAPFWAVDTCLDAGGRYDYENQQCAFDRATETPMTRPDMSLLAKQLAMNEVTFGRLRALGLTPETEVELEFSFVAPGEPQARALERLLTRETDYTIRIEVTDGSMWTVTGMTKPTAISLDVLNEWVEWMVAAGLQYDCVFDGWGTEL